MSQPRYRAESIGNGYWVIFDLLTGLEIPGDFLSRRDARVLADRKNAEANA